MMAMEMMLMKKDLSEDWKPDTDENLRDYWDRYSGELYRVVCG